MKVGPILCFFMRKSGHKGLNNKACHMNLHNY